MAIPCLHAWYLNGDLDRIVPLILAAVCAWGVAYLLVTLSVVMLRIRRPDLPRAYRSPWFPLPQIISSVGIIIAIVNITPPGMDSRQVLVPFGIMLGLTAAYALFWTVCAARQSVQAAGGGRGSGARHQQLRKTDPRGDDARCPPSPGLKRR
ncbi:hypothetical protein SB00610_01291 [Klebsiella quasipneumoniae subsp. similipneumoniae]|nr:hypothetical protein SB00610_01291 [Klebsiella quasipneumoniae subsp. similipneumoniae]